MSDPLLRAEGLGMSFDAPEGRITLFEDLELSVPRQSSVAIVGASGSGKSTLLGLLAGLDLPSHGEVWLAGEALSKLSEDQRAKLRARQLGFVFQSFHLLTGLTALDNVMLPLELHKPEGAEARAKAALAAVGLAERVHHYPSQLSGGEQQRVAIARAFVGQPALLMADEPTGNLDPHTGGAVADLLFDMNREQGTTLVLVTHDLSLAGRCERVLRLQDERLVAA